MATRRKVSEIAKEMTRKPKRIEIESKTPNIIIVDGEKYIMETELFKKIDKVEHSHKVIFKEFHEDEYAQCLDTVVEAIAGNTTKKELISELVKKVDFKSLRRLARRIETGKALKKQHGCLGFKIGDAYLQLID